MKILLFFFAINFAFCSDAISDIIVIGAGVSGLTTASLLKSDGYNVRILEARDRIGGRIDSDSRLGHTTLDLGAAWIHGIEKNPIYKLSQMNKVDTVAFDYGDEKLYSKGLSKLPNADEYYEVVSDFLEYLDELKDTNSPDESFEKALRRYIIENKLDSKAKTILNNWSYTELEIEFGTKLKYLSRDNYDDSGSFDGDDHLIPSGYIKIFEPLAKGLDIQLNTEIDRIEQVEDKVKIYDKNGKVYISYLVVVTIPLGCLKRNTIKFVPELSEKKKSAIKKMNYGTMNKIIVEFSEKFWDDNNVIRQINNPPADFPWIVNYHNVKGSNILIFLTTKEDIEIASDDEVKSMVIKDLLKIYPDENIKIINLIRTRWGTDPFSYGSYSSYGVGASRKDIKILAEEEGKIYFAGEHTHQKFPSTVHGAYLSAVEVVKKINNSKHFLE